jgi:hypothetical protein
MMQRLFATLEPMLGEQGGSIRDAQIEGTEGFKVIVSPQLVMVPGLGTPTLGVAEQQLFFGTNEQAIATALATANGRQKNFEHNERFKQEGLEVPSEATYVSFTDQTKLGEQLSAALQMAPMLTFMVPELGQSPLGRTLVGAAAKLGRVVSEFNFLQSTCTVTTFDGKVDYTKQVVNYREPPKKDTGATGGGTQTSATGE